MSAHVRRGIHSLGDVVVFGSGADERSVLPSPVRCIFAAGKRRRRRLHQLLGQWLVVPAGMRRGILCHRFEQLFLGNAHRGGVQHKPQSAAATAATAAFSIATIFTTASTSSEVRH